MTYKITYYAPYTGGNFTCNATSIEDGRRQRDAYHKKNGYCIANREIRKETCK